MIVTHTEVKKVEKEIIDKVVCNCCGKEIDVSEEDNFVHLEKSWSRVNEYHYFVNDLHSVDLCRDCCFKLEKMFKVKPEIE